MFDWLKRLFQGQSVQNKPATPQTPRQQCLATLADLAAKLDQTYNPHAAANIQIRPIKRNIEKYIDLLKEFCQTINNETPISPALCRFDELVISVDQFFVSEKGFYISHATIRDFHREARKLCELTKDGESAAFGLQEHNYRMLTTVFVNLQSVANGLLISLST